MGKKEEGVLRNRYTMSTARDLHDDAIVVDGHVHITNAVFYQGLDPWEGTGDRGF